MTVIAPNVTVMTEMANVVAELRAVRMARGLSQIDISAAAGMPEAAVSRLETDLGFYSHVAVRHLRVYAAALGYTLRFVLVADPATPLPTAVANQDTTGNRGTL